MLHVEENAGLVINRAEGIVRKNPVNTVATAGNESRRGRGTKRAASVGSSSTSLAK